MAISHAALFDEDNFRNATDRLLVEATRRDSDLVMREVLDRILGALHSLAFVQPDAAEILFADPQDGQSLVVAYSTNSADIGVRVDIDSSVCGEAFREGKPLCCSAPSSAAITAHFRGCAARWPSRSPSAAATGFRSAC